MQDVPFQHEMPEGAEPEQRLLEALRELGKLSEQQAEQLVLELLEAVEHGDLPLSALLGFTDDEIYRLYDKAHTLYEGGQARRAQGVCEGLLALDSGLPAVRLLLAACLMELRQYDAALEQVDAVLDSDAGELEAYLKRGHILYRQGRHEEAAETLCALLELAPELDADEALEAVRILEHLQALSGLAS